MGKYIDRNAQLVRLYRMNLSCEEVIKEFLMTACTVDAEPVKHGKWTRVDKNKYNDDEATCSICGVTFASGYSNPYWWDYCPNCGAKMDEVEK